MAVSVPPDVIENLTNVSEKALQYDPEKLIISEKRAIDILGIKLLELDSNSEMKENHEICDIFQSLFVSSISNIRTITIKSLEQGCAVATAHINARDFIPLFGVLTKPSSRITVSSSEKGNVLLGKGSKKISEGN